MGKLWRILALTAYYGVAKRLPTQPVPGWKIGYRLRRVLVRHIFAECGEGVIVKQNCYFGTGATLRIGSNSQLGANARIDASVTIGDDVVMGPDVVIMTISHEFEDPSIPVRLQGARPRDPVVIGNDVWIATRVIIMPGVTIGDHSIIGANSVVVRNIPPLSVAAGVPCRVIRRRGERLPTSRPPGAKQRPRSPERLV